MILPLALPPGVYQNGTVSQSAGRWYDADGVRWFEGTMRPIGGWQRVQRTSPAPVEDMQLSGIPRAMLGWRDNDGVPRLGVGTNTKIYHFAQGVLAEIQPSDLVAGDADTVTTVGAYGSGLYGSFSYGVGDAAQGTEEEAATWQLDTFGEFLVGCLTSDGRLLYWNPTP